MQKTEILKACIQGMETQLRDLEAAARASAALATDEEHRARSKYETFSLETSYLARGQAKRVAEMREALSRLRVFDFKALPATSEVRLGALIRVEDQKGGNYWYFLLPAGGGEEIAWEEISIQLITLQSPIAQLLMKKRAGDTFTFAKGTFNIKEVV